MAYRDQKDSIQFFTRFHSESSLPEKGLKKLKKRLILEKMSQNAV